MAINLEEKMQEIQTLAFNVAASCTLKKIAERCRVSHPTLKGMIDGTARPCFSTIARVYKGLSQLSKENEKE
jgi:DNA-binding phage protein